MKFVTLLYIFKTKVLYRSYNQKNKLSYFIIVWIFFIKLIIPAIIIPMTNNYWHTFKINLFIVFLCPIDE